jgi:hypothetical protein
VYPASTDARHSLSQSVLFIVAIMRSRDVEVDTRTT